jgi:hypothetical protein
MPKISLPLAGAVFRILRRNETREDRSRLMARNDLDDRRQNAFHPRRFPEAAGSKDILHIDAKMDGVPDLGDL